MQPAQSVRRVPWTCKWSRFGGSLTSAPRLSPGFVFWVCVRPDALEPHRLDRGSCEECIHWEPAEGFEQTS